tara:strand:+ start:433 stop:1407 length:975 start_codon:yes stop_codon:yes gene_type:complete
MVKHLEPDKTLVKMPSLRAVKSFVAAAKYQNFTRASESLCVTQAAISRQIRELEFSLGVDLFHRSGRTVTLTEAGKQFYDAAYLSFMNISQAAQRIQKVEPVKHELTVFCSPAFTSLWLAHQLISFFDEAPDTHVNVISTNQLIHDLNTIEGKEPDVFISKVYDPREGYKSIPLFHDIIYPVCSPSYLEEHSDIKDVHSLIDADFLNLTPYGRDQVAEHVDWNEWLKAFSIDYSEQTVRKCFNSNDYCMLIQMAVTGQGVCLGWHHLVKQLIKDGKLVRITNQELKYTEKYHYLSYPEKFENNPAFVQFRSWLLQRLHVPLSDL